MENHKGSIGESRFEDGEKPRSQEKPLPAPLTLQDLNRIAALARDAMASVDPDQTDWAD